jgi:hypothetical protein
MHKKVRLPCGHGMSDSHVLHIGPFYPDAQCCNQQHPLESFWKPAQHIVSFLGVG